MPLFVVSLFFLLSLLSDPRLRQQHLEGAIRKGRVRTVERLAGLLRDSFSHPTEMAGFSLRDGLTATIRDWNVLMVKLRLPFALV